MSDKIANILRNSPRVNLNNLKPNPYSKKKHQKPRGQHAKGIRGKKDFSNIKPRIGYTLRSTPFAEIIPKYGYNRNSHLRRDYQPLTLWQLQRMIDLGRIDPSEPIDLNTLVNARAIKMELGMNNYGVFLVEQGADIFEAKVNIEVQIANDMSISAIEKNGGMITTAFYDQRSTHALCDPVDYFLRGQPIMKRMLPPEELVTYYTDPNTRGYLSAPAEVQKARLALAQKFGYKLPDITKDGDYEMLIMRKDPRQIFFGLAPGWIVSLADRAVIKPNAEYIKDHSIL